MVHTLRWGPDGRLYFNQSIYIHTHIETPHGVERLNSGGVWQLRPSTLELGVFLRGFCNPWGHQFDEFGQSFETDGAGYQGISYGLPGATYFTYANMRREFASISPGNYPKFCGLEIVRSGHFPSEWQGHAITCDFRAHRIVRFEIREEGAGYSAREVSDLLRTTNVTFRPIDVKLGPDGALYVADWSNPIIQHGEVDFRDPRRDHEHGRIWRITAKDRPLVPRPKLVGVSNRELLDQLLSANSFNEEQARRVLAERGRAIHADLDRWTAKQTSEKALLQALWMNEAINEVEPRLLERVLEAKDGRIRAAAVRVACEWTPRLKNPVEILAVRMKDSNPRVRLEAMRALATIPSARSAELVLGEVDKPMDRFLDYAAWLSINDLARPWTSAVKTGQWKTEGREKQLEFALKAIQPALASEVITVVMNTRDIPRDGRGPWVELIGSAGDTKLLSRLFDQLLKGGFDEATQVRALKALNVAAKDRDAKPDKNLAELGKFLAESRSGELRAEAIRLAGRWRLNSLSGDLAAIARNSSGSVRQAAFDSLRDIGGKEAIAALGTLSAGTNSLSVRKPATLALAGIDFDAAKATAVGLLIETTNETESAELWRSLLSIKGAATGLAHALPKTGLPAGMARAGLRVAREGGRNEPDLVWALTRGANLEEETQTLSAAELQELAKTALRDGDAARGERIFRRKDLSCTVCHAIGGVGGKVGPDLTSIGASAQADYLIESVLYPNRKIKEGYHSVSVETKGGMEYTGVIASENNEALVLRDAAGKEISVAKKDIETRTTGGSLMPSGLVDPLSAGQRLDLYKFLSELGKPGPFDASKSTVARAWKLFPQTLDAAQFGDERILKTELEAKEWTPAVSLVDGRLLKRDLEAPLTEVKSRDPRAIFAAARCEVTKPGAVAFKLTGADTSAVWIDGQPVKSGRAFAPELQPGKHTVFIRLDAKKLPDALRLESQDATFLAN
jgi:putative heme-binding domain-containing protein